MGTLSKSRRQHEQDCLLAVLRQLRQASDLRQIDLAGRIGEPQSFVSKYESGERRLDILELRLICAALGITLAALVANLETCIAEIDVES